MFNKIKPLIVEKLYEYPYSIKENYNNKKCVNSLKYFFENSKNNQRKFKSFLIDGGYYNLAYFYRLQLLRSALKSKKIKENAFIWDCNLNVCKSLLKNIGIRNITFMDTSFDKDISSKAKTIMKKINSKSDLINIKLPYDIPGLFLYDTVLKRQRSASIDINDPSLEKYIYKFLCSIKFTEKLLNKSKPDIIALSHCISYQCTPIAWLASQKKIPVIILGGDFNTPRLWRITKPRDIFRGVGRPCKNDFRNFSNTEKNKLRTIGREYIINRISGNTSDLGGRYAYQRNKSKLVELGINKKNKKIIAIYSACFFDFPHTYGMNRFTDMMDWLEFTLKKASENKEVLWLLKPHPMEQWYGGIKLIEILINKLPNNIKLLPYSYSGKDIIEISDGVVTLHGTCGIEFAAMGKPVLIADQGWYHDCDFAMFPKSREDYGNLLTTNWFDKVNITKTKNQAELFSGIFFGIPKWQKDLILPDDGDKELLRQKIPYFVRNEIELIGKEINLIKRWINSASYDYHGFKILNNKKFFPLVKN